MGIYYLRFSSTFVRNLQQNKQTLWVILQRFWQKTNQKMLILSVYNEVKTKYIYNQVYSYRFNEENHLAFKTNTNRSLMGSYN